MSGHVGPVGGGASGSADTLTSCTLRSGGSVRMRLILQLSVGALLALAVIVVTGLLYVKESGLRGQPKPGTIETRVARAIRALAIPGEVRARTNPRAASEGARRLGLEHFARYCALCHGNDGTGETSAFGRGLFPKPPDMRADATQSLTDGELFYIIENGVRFTGMPAFGTGRSDPAGDAQVWELVTFIRRLPQITADEVSQMESLNPL
jgi:mono/diheme cytochrome c family protein